MLKSLPNKELDVNQTILVTPGLDTTAVQSIISKTYYKELSLNSTYGTVLRASSNVDWKYDSSTKKITSLYPETTFWHTGISPWYHVIGGWVKNTQFITTPTSGDRGFVQKGREIMIQDGGQLTPAEMFKFNLVFSPSATNTTKTLLNDTGVTNIILGDYTNWGGGY